MQPFQTIVARIPRYDINLEQSKFNFEIAETWNRMWIASRNLTLKGGASSVIWPMLTRTGQNVCY